MSSGADAEPYVLSILVMPAQANHLGVMHGGHMMSWMDMAAWVVATRAVIVIGANGPGGKSPSGNVHIVPGVWLGAPTTLSRLNPALAVTTRSVFVRLFAIRASPAWGSPGISRSRAGSGASSR